MRRTNTLTPADNLILPTLRIGLPQNIITMNHRFRMPFLQALTKITKLIVPRTITELAASIATVSFLAICLLHAFLNACEILNSRYNEQFLLGAAIAGSLIILCVCVSYYSLHLTRYSVTTFAFGLILAIFIVKVVWCISFDSIQPTDFARYVTYGQQIARGDWQAINADNHQFREVFTQRSFYYTAPVFYIFGPHKSALEIVNVFIQCLGLCFFYDIARKMTNQRVAASSILPLTFYPDWWFSTTLASHDVLANTTFLGILCICFRLPLFFDASSRSFQLKDITKTALLSTIIGCISGFFEAQRGFGILIVAGVFLLTFRVFLAFVQPRLIGEYTRNKQELTLFITLLFTFLLSYGCSTQILRSVALKQIQKPNPQSFLTYLAASDTDTANTVRDMLPFRFLYPSCLPEEQAKSFLIRKSLWERFSQAEELPAHLVKKNVEYASAARIMEFAFCNQEEEWFQTWDLEYWSAKRVVCALLYCWLLGFSAFRLGFMYRPQESLKELFFVSILTVFFLILMLVSESGQSYDQLFAIPLAINAGALMTKADSNLQFRTKVQNFRTFFSGTILLLLIFSISWVIGKLVDNPKITFARLKPISSTTQNSLDGPRYGIGLDVTEDDFANAEARQTIYATGFAPGKQTLCYIISADHAKQGLFWPIDWKEFRCRYTIKVEDIVVKSGDISELSSPIFQQQTITVPGDGRVKIELSLSNPQSNWVNPFRFDLTPRLAVEYMYAE